MQHRAIGIVTEVVAIGPNVPTCWILSVPQKSKSCLRC